MQFNNSGAFGGADIRWVDPYLEMPIDGTVATRAKIGMQSGADNGAFTANAGNLLTYGGDGGPTPQGPGGGSGGFGGEIRTNGGNGFTSGDPGGDYGGGNGGYIHTYGGDATDGLNGNPGGYINTSNGGGNIDTSNNGGSIITTGTGSIGFGAPTTRTTLNGTATSNQTISLPDASGTLLLQNGALGTPSSGTLTNCTGLPVAGITASTSTALGVGSLNIGHASDTTLARSSAGNLTIEGNLIYRAGGSFVGMPFEYSAAVSDETTALTAGTTKLTFRMPCAMTVTSVRASVGTAPTGSTLIVDINENGTSILSTKLSIDVTEKTSTTAAVPAVISDSALADDSEITIDIDQIGSTIAG
ncbi:MAG: hypothetical protein LW645_06915, partial [Verrucomicrobiaceae bacterium]|nr:hypothetical protein [Verrucomicrobiaceae bacterium]